MQPLFDAYSARTGTVIQRESGASLEHVRKLTELHRVPDLMMLADAEVIPQLLLPKHAKWYAEFARNRMVVAYTARSKHAGEINANNWTAVLQRPDIEVGRTDPNLAPAGYRTLLMFQLAERHYDRSGLAAALLKNTPNRNVRPNAAELAALLAAGELDYIYDYQSVAESNGFKYLILPNDIDLSDASLAAQYATASVKVRGTAPGESLTIKGQPILYGLTVPDAAPHPAAAKRFLDYLTSPQTVAALRAAHVDMLDHPVVVGTGAPAEVHGAVRR